MNKKHYFLKLIPPRPTFPLDMTPEERSLMEQHAGYTREHFAAGKLLIYGSVMASDGAFGMAVLEVADEDEARRFIAGDPTVQAGLNRWELAPMRVGAARGTET